MIVYAMAGLRERLGLNSALAFNPKSVAAYLLKMATGVMALSIVKRNQLNRLLNWKRVESLSWQYDA